MSIVHRQVSTCRCWLTRPMPSKGPGVPRSLKAAAVWTKGRFWAPIPSLGGVRRLLLDSWALLGPCGQSTPSLARMNRGEDDHDHRNSLGGHVLQFLLVPLCVIPPSYTGRVGSDCLGLASHRCGCRHRPFGRLETMLLGIPSRSFARTMINAGRDIGLGR